jgi:hypothetical protein
LIRKVIPQKMVCDWLRDLAPEGLAVDLFEGFCSDAHQVVRWDAASALVVVGDLLGDGRELVRNDQNLVRRETPAATGARRIAVRISDRVNDVMRDSLLDQPGSSRG